MPPMPDACTDAAGWSTDGLRIFDGFGNAALVVDMYFGRRITATDHGRQDLFPKAPVRQCPALDTMHVKKSKADTYPWIGTTVVIQSVTLHRSSDRHSPPPAMLAVQENLYSKQTDAKWACE